MEWSVEGLDGETFVLEKPSVLALDTASMDGRCGIEGELSAVRATLSWGTANATRAYLALTRL